MENEITYDCISWGILVVPGVSYRSESSRHNTQL